MTKVAENMPKLQSPYKRAQVEINGSKHYVVTNQIDPDLLWVFEDPEVYAMEKLDGTNVSVVIENGILTEVWNRKNLVTKLHNFNTDDEYWENTEGFNHVSEAIDNSIDFTENLSDGQHFGECIGLGIQNNPMDIPDKRWVPFLTYGKENLVYDDWSTLPKDFESISNYMRNLKSKYYSIQHPGKEEYAEGIILYRPSTGERAKLRRDMFDWWIKDNPGVINKHVNTYNKSKIKTVPEGMNGEFALLSARKKQGLISFEEYSLQRDIILKKYGVGGK